MDISAIIGIYNNHANLGHEAACNAVFNAGFDAGLMATTTSTTPLPEPVPPSPAPVVEEAPSE